jgi:hypothetical protein
MVIESGKFLFNGTPIHAIERYLSIGKDSVPQGYLSLSEKEYPFRANGRIMEARITSGSDYSCSGYPIGAPIEFRVKCFSEGKIPNPALGIGIDNFLGQRIVSLDSEFDPLVPRPIVVSGEFSFVCRVHGLALLPGDYRVRLCLNQHGTEQIHILDNALSLTITPRDFYGNGGKWGKGLILCEQKWEIVT